MLLFVVLDVVVYVVVYLDVGSETVGGGVG